FKDSFPLFFPTVHFQSSPAKSCNAIKVKKLTSILVNDLVFYLRSTFSNTSFYFPSPLSNYRLIPVY
ncbi:hypothetical protein PP707_03820, partial [Acetobacter pasteurianus]|nr:hypothetical protein [Acetobacter pasteurianus]